MIKHLLTLILAFSITQIFAKESQIYAFGGYYTHQPKYYPLTIHFKADQRREWGGYKISDSSSGPSAYILSYSFRNSRFEYNYITFQFESVKAIGKAHISKSTIRYSAIAYDINDGTPVKTIRGTFRRTPKGLIHNETVIYFDSPDAEYPPNIPYHSHEIFYRK